MDAADWDLHAVVRGCAAATSTAALGCSRPHFSTTTTTSVSEQGWNNFSITSFQNPFSPCAEASDLHDIYKPFYPNPNQQQQQRNAALNQKTALSPPQSLPISPLSVLNGLPDLSCEQQQKQMNQTQQIVFEQLPLQKQHHSLSVANGSKVSPRCKKRKSHLKKICHVPVEELSSDSWSWRKYGQKPIKGSPYPRGYYKCSTSKSCPARKQVERDRSDPAMFIVTYSSEHNHAMPTHRSSLAGTTRSTTTTSATASSSMADIPSPPSSNSEKFEVQCQDHELIEAEEENDDLISVLDVPFDDDFFAGLEDLTGRECGLDGFV